MKISKTIFLLLLILPFISINSVFAQSDVVYKVVDNMPRFSGCEDEPDISMKKACAVKKMLGFISDNLNYPREAKKKRIRGTVVVTFIVNKDGVIENPKILRDIGGGCGEEALRIINLMPQWTPGSQRGKAVKVQFNLPVKFWPK